jgi:hypothetical protein
MRNISTVRAAALSIMFFAELLSPALAFDAKIWTESRRDTGTTFLQCKADACGGPSAIVSFHAQTPGSMPTHVAFLKRAATVNQMRQSQGVTSKRVLDQDDSKPGIRHFFLLDQITYPNGTVEFFASGYLEAGGRAWSLGASGTSKESVAGNYDELVTHVQALK